MATRGTVSRAAVITACVVLCAAPRALQGQRIAESSAGHEQAQTTPTVRLAVFDGLAEAQACVEEEDFECAAQKLDRLLSTRGLIGYETALVWQAYGALYITDERYADALVAFENLLRLDELPPALEQTVLYTVAQLYGHEGEYERAVETLDRWLEIADRPTPEAWALKARFLYALERYAETIEPARTAFGLLEERGASPDEALYQILQYSYLALDRPIDAIAVGTEIVERWPKKQHVVTLAALYGQIEEDDVQLALYEAAFEAGWLRSGPELTSYARLLLAGEVPYKAALILERGLEDGTIEATREAWDMLSQAWRGAPDDERAIAALLRASELAVDGEIDQRLAISYAALLRWEDCVTAAERALERGLQQPSDAHVQRGSCLIGLERYAEARDALAVAARTPSARETASRWLSYVEAEEKWGLRLEAMKQELRELERARLESETDP